VCGRQGLLLSTGQGWASFRNDVLGQIFGSKDVSRTVAQSAAEETGLEPSLLKKMLRQAYWAGQDRQVA